MSMTENEAIRELEDYFAEEHKQTISFAAITLARKALEEIQQYRAIGTVEELKSMKENGAFTGVELAQLAAMHMRLKEYSAIGTIEEFKALKEKSVAKKAEWKFDDFTAKFGNPYHCSNCDEEFGDTYNYCPNCGCDMYAD